MGGGASLRVAVVKNMRNPIWGSTFVPRPRRAVLIISQFQQEFLNFSYIVTPSIQQVPHPTNHHVKLVHQALNQIFTVTLAFKQLFMLYLAFYTATDEQDTVLLRA